MDNSVSSFDSVNTGIALSKLTYSASRQYKISKCFDGLHVHWIFFRIAGQKSNRFKFQGNKTF